MSKLGDLSTFQDPPDGVDVAGENGGQDWDDMPCEDGEPQDWEDAPESTPNRPDFVLTDQERRALVRYYAGEHYECYYASWIYSYCFGDEWERRAYANHRIELIAKVIGDDAADEEFVKGRKEYVQRQDPMLWRMYQCGVEPARCKHGYALHPGRCARLSGEDEPCTCDDQPYTCERDARSTAMPDTNRVCGPVRPSVPT